MKTVYSAYKTDPDMEQNGIVLDFGVGRFHVRRAGGSNRLFYAKFNELTMPHKRAIANGNFQKEKSQEIMMRVYAAAVVTGWTGPLDDDGQPTPFYGEDYSGNPIELVYNEKNFVKVMKDLPDLWDSVVSECDRHTNFQKQADADGQVLGN